MTVPSPDDRVLTLPSSHGVAARYGFALAAVAVMTSVRLLLSPALGEQPGYGCALLAVVLTAWYGGRNAALAAVFLGAVAWDFAVLHPHPSLTLLDTQQRTGLSLYMAVGFAIALLGGAMRRAQERSAEAAAAEHAAMLQVQQEVDRRAEAESELRRANEHLEARVHERTAELAAAYESLRTGEALLAGVVGSAMDGIVAVDEQQRITFVNSAAEEMFGYSAAELLDQPLEKLIPERFRAVHGEHMRAFAGSNEPHRRRGELRLIHGLRNDGTEFPLEVSLTQMVVAGRRLFTATLHDITERKRVEAELQTSRSQLLAALEAGGMATWSLNLESGTVQWDDATLKIWGRKREDVADDSIATLSSFLHAEDRHIIRDLVSASRRDGNVARTEYRILLPDGTVRWHASRGLIERNAEGRPTRYTGVILDISDRKRTEEGRLRSHKLEALGTLAGGIAHDFNNILLAISGNTKLAASDLPPEHPVQESLTEIAKASARAADVVKRILTFSRPQDQQPEVLQLQPVVEEVLRLLHATLPASIEIRTEFRADVPAVLADSTQVHQIIVNLMTNAADAIVGGGRIDVALEAMNVDSMQAAVLADLREGLYVRLSVRDTGCGMDAATAARIFDPFFTTKPAGTGLGLSVVHGIMKSHAGAVTVYSEPGRGTTFHLYFPAVDGSDRSVAAAHPEPRRGHGEHILYVDDEDALVTLATRVLKRLGYQVSGFSDPRLALEEFRSHPADFDVVVTDLSMPHLPGFELAREMRRVRPDVPIVMTSGYVEPQIQEAAMQEGVYAVLLKPDTVEELGEVLDRLLRDRDASR